LSIKIKYINLKKNLLSLVLLGIVNFCFGQDWSVRFKQSGYDDTRAAIETYDKGIVFPICHVTGADYFDIVKLDFEGNLLWKKTYRFNSGNIFGLLKIIKLEKGGYLLSGLSTSIDTQDGDPFVVKFNECFEPEWQVIYNEEVSGYNFLSSIIEIPNSNNLILTVENFNNAYNTLLKVNETADSILFHKTFDNDLGRYHLLGKNLFYFGSVALGTKANPNLKKDKALNYKLDTTGVVYWSKIGKLNDTNHIAYYSASAKYSETMFLAGYNNRRPNAKDNRITESFYLRKIDTSGYSYWNMLLGDTTKNEVPTLILKLNDNKYAIYCAYYPEPSISDQFYGRMYIVDSTGTVLNKEFVDQRTINSTTSGFTMVLDMIATSDSKILTVGQLVDNGDFDVICKKYNEDLTFVQKTNSNLKYDSLCTNPVKDSTYILPQPKVLHLVKDSFPLDSLSYSNAPVLSVSPTITTHTIQCIIYPNPFEASILISINGFDNLDMSIDYVLTDQLGRVIAKNGIKKPDTFINLADEASGIYYLTINNVNVILSSYKIIKK
jgi:hypothetical protein